MSLPSRGPEEVPTALRSKLVATFNSGFKLADSGGGFALGGHTYAPLKDGLGDDRPLHGRPRRRDHLDRPAPPRPRTSSTRARTCR